MADLIPILGTDEMPHKPTELEELAEEVAQNYNLNLETQENGLDEWGWGYYYSRKAESKKHTIMYTMHYTIGEELGPVIPFEEAKSTLLKQRDARVYEESFAFFRGDALSFHVLYMPQINLEKGRYSVSWGQKNAHLKLPQIKVLFEEAITCKFLKKRQKSK